MIPISAIMQHRERASERVKSEGRGGCLKKE